MNELFDFSETTAAQLSMEEKVGQLFMPAAFINDTEAEIVQLEHLIRSGHIGGICFFHSRASAATNYEGEKEIPFNADSFETLKQLIQRYQRAASIPLLIAIDAEWGLAMRVENTPCYPYALTLGAMKDETELVYLVGSQIGADCRAAGIHWNFAPVADINNNPDNPVIGYRSFGSNKKQVSRYAIAMSKGMQSQGILTSAKHFPGHGDTATDSHLGIPVIDKTREALEENELTPFRELIVSGVDSVMIGHLAVPSLTGDTETPATLSEKLIKEVLRKELNFTGVVVSDALNMHAVSKRFQEKGELEYRAFRAGIDLFCFAENPLEGIRRISEKGNKEAIEDSFRRIWQLKSRCIQKQNEPAPPLSNANPINLEVARKSLTLIGTKPLNLKDTHQDLNGIQFGKVHHNLFFEKLGETGKFRSINIDPESELVSIDTLDTEVPLLLAIFPPSVKPTGNFGFSEHSLRSINKLLQHPKVSLYLFGNPYFLKLLDLKPQQPVVIAYQQFDEFQSVAAAHVRGACEAIGKLPVQFKLQDHGEV